jgi:hypothetical protein
VKQVDAGGRAQSLSLQSDHFAHLDKLYTVTQREMQFHYLNIVRVASPVVVIHTEEEKL